LKNGHGKEVSGKKLSIYTIVEETPSKKTEKPMTSTDSGSSAEPSSQSQLSSKFWSKSDLESSSDDDSDTTMNGNDASYEFDETKFLKRKAKFSPSPADEEFRQVKNKNGRKKVKANHSTKSKSE
jgi:hypothetical protein